MDPYAEFVYQIFPNDIPQSEVTEDVWSRGYVYKLDDAIASLDSTVTMNLLPCMPCWESGNRSLTSELYQASLERLYWLLEPAAPGFTRAVARPFGVGVSPVQDRYFTLHRL